MGDEKEPNLPRRDWILLPTILVLTVLLLPCLAEGLARLYFPVSESGMDQCFDTLDVTGNASVRPNSACSERVAESRYTTQYRFNDRGDREDVNWHPKDPGSYRIVMIGSSMAMGLFVPRENTFAATLPEKLSHATSHPIELYNEARGGKFRGGPFPQPDAPKQFSKALSAAPDLILWIITPLDIENAFPEPDPLEGTRSTKIAAAVAAPNSTKGFWPKLWSAVTNGEVESKIRRHWDESRTSLVLQHLLLGLQSRDQYVASYLKDGSNADFLKTQPSAKWQASLRHFDSDAADFEEQAHAAGVPLVAVMLPSRAQAAMLAMDHPPPSYDSYKLDQELRQEIVADGGIYLDVLPVYAKIPNPQRDFFPVDGHPDAQGQRVISDILANVLLPVITSELQLQGNSRPLLKIRNAARLPSMHLTH
jgi:hypothetical protein